VWLNLHDSCGVNNLHGMPGLFAAFLSVVVCHLASEDVYGKRSHVYIYDQSR
jgi:ammonium transporter Rh